MPTPPLPDELALEAAEAFRVHGTKSKAASALNLHRNTFDSRLNVAARRGMLLDQAPAMPGFEVAQLSTEEDETGAIKRRFIKQKPEGGEQYEPPPGHTLKGASTLVNSDGRTIQTWYKTAADAEAREKAAQAALQGFLDKVPKASPAPPLQTETLADLLSQYTITDSHLGMLAWHEEAGEDYDLSIAENLIRRFLTAAIDMSPASETAILAQLGDFLHYDSHKSITPEHQHLLDTDSRFQKVVRAAIRILRWAVARLLEKHQRVHVIMADANHDPASGAWLREMFAAFFENEPRVSVDTLASTYYCYEHGEVALFYHHGHRKKPKDVDSVFAGTFRALYGRTKHAYAHMGHKHADELLTTNLMKVEQHETLAAKDAYAANGGWLSGRSAKVIHYHKRFGEVSRSVITPEMLAA